MKKKIPVILFVFSIIIGIQKISAQLNVSSGLSAAQYVNYFVGNGITFSNASLTSGTPNAFGYFTNGNTTNIGMTSGVIMCTGPVNGNGSLVLNPPIGSPSSEFLSMSNNGGSDPDLLELVMYPGVTLTDLKDAAILQFDFVPITDTIKFRYSFASEEYTTFVCSSFNDVFGFFVSGPGLTGPFSNGAVNIALIPGTTLPVSINSLNGGVANGGPASNCVSLAYSSFYTNNSTGGTICFDGFTKVLTAWAKVTPCSTYHIKLAICDVGDAYYDSGVFLQENSFSQNGSTSAIAYSNTATFGNNAVEGCADATVTFNIATPATSPFTINYTIGGTATNGVDYTTIPSSVTIPIGGTSASITIHPLLDGIAEGTENVTITSMAVTCGVGSTITIPILNNNPIIALASANTAVCSGQPANISVAASGGISPYTYLWNNGAGTNASVNVTPTVTTTYIVTVTDGCSNTATDDVVVSISPQPVITAPANITVCSGTAIPAGSITSTPAGATYTWTNSNTAIGLAASGTGQVPAFTANNTTSAAITGTISVTPTIGTCVGTPVTYTITVNPLPVITAPANITVCSGTAVPAGSITSTPAGATYTWTNSNTAIGLAASGTGQVPAF
ncbi:MAG: choice-of-anchor L domain-containing protein, partial [Bacteroidota bacterium]